MFPLECWADDQEYIAMLFPSLCRSLTHPAGMPPNGTYILNVTQRAAMMVYTYILFVFSLRALEINAFSSGPHLLSCGED